jgi:hypothetical protein
VAGDAFLGSREQVRGVNPLVQGNVAALEYRPDRHAKGFLAFAALVDAFARALALQLVDALRVGIATMRAKWAFRPKEPFEMLASGGFVSVNLLQFHGLNLSVRPVYSLQSGTSST